jgi:hypothetical protein
MTKILGLRTCNADMTSHGDFKWPESGPVECPDWDPTDKCGYGLHFLPWGEGKGSLLKFDEGAKWLVIEADEADVVEITANGGGKSKCSKCVVLFCGDREGATKFLLERAPGRAIVGAIVQAGDYGTATAGDRGTATAGVGGTATAGYGGTATAGDHGTATAGYGGTATAGDRGTATAGDGGTATAGDRGTATAGDRGTATAGDGGTATAGYGGTATAGYGGTATAGDYGTATAGDHGTATAGVDGTLSLKWWAGSRYRIAIFYVGEDGILPNTKYRCENGKAVRV